jgi:hypothetical protein
MERVKKIARGLFDQKVSFLSVVSIFLGVIFLRVFVEQFIARSTPLSSYEIVIEYIHNLYFFSISFCLISFLLSYSLKLRPSQAQGALVFAAILILFPPLIDMARTGGEVFWSFYSLSSLSEMPGQFVTFFGHLPSGIMYFGTRIIFLIAVLLVGFLVWSKTEKIARSLFSALGTYIILFVMGNFPGFFLYIW